MAPVCACLADRRVAANILCMRLIATEFVQLEREAPCHSHTSAVPLLPRSPAAPCDAWGAGEAMGGSGADEDIHSSLRRQLEYYFSPLNLARVR